MRSSMRQAVCCPRRSPKRARGRAQAARMSIRRSKPGVGAVDEPAHGRLRDSTLTSSTLSPGRVDQLASPRRREQRQRIELQPPREPFDAAQCQVALAALHTAHVGPMHTEHIGERLLAEPALLPEGPKVPSDRTLQLALHWTNVDLALLDGLQTYT